MLPFVRNNSPYTAIILFVLAIALNIQSLIHPILPIATEQQAVYGLILSFFHLIWGHSALAFSILTVFIIYFQAILINQLASKHRLYQQNNYIPAFVFIILHALHPSLSSFSPILLVNFTLILLLNEFLGLKQAQKANIHLFNIGFYLMIACLIQFSSIFLIPFLFFTLLLLRPFNFKEWIIVIVGMLMPLYIQWVILFCTDKTNVIGQWPYLGISLPNRLVPAKYFLGLFAGLIVWFTISLYNMQILLPKATIYIRRCWISITSLLLVSIFAAIFSPKQIDAAWAICLPALSLMMSFALINERNKKMSTISFYFALALALFCQIFLPS